MKKWSYVAVAFMIAGSSMALTSCIDNDEPFGIEQIRLATANLLDAKKAAVEAEAAAKSAQVEIAKINAEIEKLRIENEKIQSEANAKIAEAEAKKIEAEAEAVLLRAQGEKAVSDAEAAKLLAEAAAKAQEADYWQAMADAYRLDAQGRYEQTQQSIARAQQDAANAQRIADQKYAEAVYRFEKKKTEDANTANSALWTLVNNAFDDYLGKIDAYNKANKTYMEELNKLAAIEADLVWKDGYFDKDQNKNIPGHFECPSYDKKRSVEKLIAKREREIATYTKTQDIYDEFIAKLDAFNEGDWAQLLGEYEQKLADADVALAQAKLEQEAVKLDQKDVFDAPKDSLKKYEDFLEKWIEIPEQKIKPIAILSVLNPSWAQEKTVIGTGTRYQLSNPFYDIDGDRLPDPSSNQSLLPFDQNPYVFNSNGSNLGYKVKVDKNNPQSASVERYFNLWIRDFQLAMLDDNDVLWTEARYTELKRDFDEGQGANDKALENWTAAKKVYNNGAVPEDLSALPLEKELEAAIEAWNELGPKAQALQDAYTAAQEKENEADAALTAATDNYNNETGAIAVYTKAQQTYNDAVNDANKAYNDALAASRKEYQLALANIDLTKKNKYQEYNQALLAYEKIQLDPNAKPSDVSKAQLEAQKKLDAYNAYAYDSWDDEKGEPILSGATKDQQKAAAAQTAANDKAAVAQHEAKSKATDALLAAEKVFNAAGGYISTDKDPAYVAVAEASKDYAAAQEATQEAQSAKDKFYTDNDIDGIWQNLNDAVANQLSELQVSSWPDETIPTAAERDAFKNGSLEFTEAIHPAMYKDASQVYSNAKWLVKQTSYIAYGDLGVNYDLNGNMTYDWQSDEAFLIDTVDKTVMDDYITKYLIAFGYEKDQINEFTIARQYWRFGSDGYRQYLLTQMGYAEIVINNKDNNAITEKIDELTAARDAMLTTLNDKEKEAQKLWDGYVGVYDKMNDLVEEAGHAVDNADYIFDAYKKIVDNLKTYVDGLEDEEFKDFYYGDYGTTAEDIKKNLEKDINDNKDKLAIAQEALQYYQYQLAQLESDEYAKVENPQKYEVEYWKAQVDKAEEAMNFAKAHYEELQAKYDALYKQQ